MAASSIEFTVEEARTSWLCNTTRGDARWRLKQLHGLHELLMANRDEIVSTIVLDYSIRATLVERQLAHVMSDLAAHVINTERKVPHMMGDMVWGKTLLEYHPYGVTLILSGSSDPLCDAVAPLASSIAAGNVVILGGVGSNNDNLFSIIRRELPNYMDTFSTHILLDVNLEQIRVDDVQQVFIFDDSPEKYSFLLAHPKSKFYSTKPGYNFAVVDAGKVNQEKLVQDILQCSRPSELPSRALSAVFVRDEIAQDIYQLLCQKAGNLPSLQNGEGPDIPCVHLGEMERSKCAVSLPNALDRAQNTGIPAVVICTSLDQALDTIEKIEGIVGQIAILSAASKKHVDYMRNWTSAPVILIDSIRALASTAIRESLTTQKGHTPCMYPATIFSWPQLTITGAAVQPLESISSIRSSYEATFPAYKAEPRGERVGFFDQVLYVVQGVGAVVGVLGIIGLWYGGKAARGYFKG